MVKNRKILTVPIFLSIILTAVFSYAEDEIEDLIDIFETNRKIIGIIEGKKTISFNLQPKEIVLWKASEGDLGAVLTNDRFFVLSTSSRGWKYLHLRSNESEKATASLSPYITLLLTKDRAIGYNTTFNQFVETRLPIHDKFVTAKVEKYVAVVVTSSQAIGFDTKTSRFTITSLRAREKLQAIKITSRKVVVRTSDRLLTFRAEDSAWNGYRL